MKTTYIQPQMTVLKVETESMLAGSFGASSSDLGIGFGGVDYDGSMDADVKKQQSDWDMWGR